MKSAVSADTQVNPDAPENLFHEVEDYAIIVLDPNGRITTWNKGAAKIKGYSASEIIGKNHRIFYTQEDKDVKLSERLLNEAREAGRTNYEGWRLKKDGTRFWGSVTLTALHNENGSLRGFLKVTRDLTGKKIAEDKIGNVLEELRQANELLKESEERYHKMVSEVQDYAIILLDVNGDIQNWNAGAEYIKGYKAHEIVGKNFRSFYGKADRDAKLPEKLLALAVRNGKANHEGWRLRKDGTTFWGSVVITALHNGDGHLIGFSKVTRDLTERKLNEDMLKANAAQLDLKNKTLERLNEELTSFTHVASHDMKEPLRKIMAFASKIESNEIPPQSKEYLEKIKSSAKRMQTLIDDLLSYSRINKETEGFEKVNLNNVIDAVKNDLEFFIAEKNAMISSAKLPTVKGVSHQLEQLFLNLISNSLKFSKPDVTPHITIQAEIINAPEIPGQLTHGKQRYCHITVHDNGIGFDNHENDKIFEPFYRLHSKQTYSGTGIGLATVKRVVENHSGIISAESVVGEGSTFHVYLPVN